MIDLLDFDGQASAVLELKDVCFTIQKEGEDVNLVDRANLKIPRGHFMAIVGPSGCGKTTLLKTIAGLNPESAGALFWDGRNLSEEGDFEPSEIGYVPQFSIAYDPLTVDESIEAATRLRVKTRDAEDLDHRIDHVLEETGMTAIADRAVKVLSGGQKRRLGLAMELVSDPKLLLCDEVTSGLDPRSEREIVRLLHDLSRRDGRIVLSVTHSLAHLELYDSILVLHEGRVAYHGPPELVTHYFSVEDSEEIYPKLATQPSERWRESWMKHQEAYYEKLERSRKRAIEAGALHVPETHDEEDPEEAATVRTPGFIAQLSTLLSRRWRIFFRDRGQVFLQLAILLCFPLLVILFSDKANAPIPSLSDSRQENILVELKEANDVYAAWAKVGSAISGVVMFQVILLSLMGSNNSAREIAGERQIFEKEKFGGLRPMAYLSSKVVFLSCLVAAQSVWMGVFVNFFGPFRGEFSQHLMFLLLINGAMTAICLGISALMRTAEQASLLSIYLVGFQLPLSGAVLALPDHIEQFTRPFISAYWSWSGSIEALESKAAFAVDSVISTRPSAHDACLYTLLLHVGAGLLAAWIGSRRHQWD
ncbi:ATP-binding cassette domain-containing protein [Haloferula sp. A504]|uniref:ATP-binding cassette domain-containing protein n=1 Tax=Haloferula sp. A504 TaxID=3373601 RepID=UPI0031CA817C|nr:ATP-binding cassette domain-containing protein [Verrucomicrobiaceae bacterium E54]